MKVRFTTRATEQIATALDYVAARSPQGAARVRDRLTLIVAVLEMHPFAGRKTNRPHIRRLVVTPYPYLIDYRVAAMRLSSCAFVTPRADSSRKSRLS